MDCSLFGVGAADVRQSVPSDDVSMAPPVHAAVLQVISTWILYHDQRLWSRTQTLFGIQLAVLAGEYALRPKFGMWAIAAIGTFISLVLAYLATLDIRSGAVNNNLFDAYA